MPILPPTHPTPLSPASSVEEFLTTFDTYILVLAKKSLSTIRNTSYSATLSLDIDDLAQRVRTSRTR